MSWSERLNRRIARAAAPQWSHIDVQPDTLSLTTPNGSSVSLNFSDLAFAAVYHRDTYAADVIVLALGFANRMTIEFFQDHPQWGTLMTALDRSGKIERPSATWQLEAMAGAPDPLILLGSA